MGLAKRLNQRERTLSKPPTEAAGTGLWAAHNRPPQTYPFFQKHPQVVHSTVLVITPHDRLNLGPTEALRVFLDQQLRWLSLEELSREPDHYSLLVGLSDCYFKGRASGFNDDDACFKPTRAQASA